MEKHLVTILNDDIKLEVEEGKNLLSAIQEAKLALDAPCGGKGQCGKCKVLVNGEEIQPQNKVLTEDIETLRKEILTNQSLTNLQYWDKVLKLRSALLKRGDEDPFVPQGQKVNATSADYATAEKVATIMQEMVDNAEGDPNVFLNEYQRRVKDTNLRK